MVVAVAVGAEEAVGGAEGAIEVASSLAAVVAGGALQEPAGGAAGGTAAARLSQSPRTYSLSNT